MTHVEDTCLDGGFYFVLVPLYMQAYLPYLATDKKKYHS